ncbi:MAG: gliding motility-associated C-terminal domain-containing protein [Bacteroidia bacterium]|nr:gliding motility-associated C-terminal domain-containing protein [Bacteroidia bacterium]
MIKINVDLNPIFYKIYFNNEYLQANFRNFNLANDKILFIGKTINPVSGQLKTFFISTDTLGNIINQTLYPCQNDHNPNIICESKASNFIIIGSKSFPNANDVADISITKINEEGKVLLSKYIGGIGSDYISNIQSPFVYQNDTLYFLARTTSFSNDGLERPLLIKMDVNGNLLKAVLIMDTVSVGFYQELSFSKFDSTLLIISSAVFNNSGGHEYSRLITTNLNLRGICNSIDVTDSLHEFNFDQSWEAGNFQMANLNWDFVDAGIGIDSFPIVEKLVCFCNATSLFSFQQNSTGKEVQFTNTSQHCDYYEWHFGDGSTSTDENPMHVYEDTGTYSVWLVAYNDSCRDTTWHTLEVKGEYLEVTNAFSPNDDGVNDFWELKNRGIVSFSVSILNRWGSLVFESNDVSKSWDGKLKGQNVVSGTYFYVIKAKGISGKSYDTKGFLEVLK